MAIIKAESVIDQWQDTLPRGGELSEDFLNDVWKRVYEMGLPVHIGFDEAATGLLKQAMGKSRKFLVMNPQDKTLDVFRLLHYAFPVGNAITFGWFAVDYNRKLGTSTGIRLPLINDLDLFSNADLLGLFSTIHDWAVIPSAQALAQRCQQDPGSIVVKSKGGMFGVG
jgi:hypothetical protein